MLQKNQRKGLSVEPRPQEIRRVETLVYQLQKNTDNLLDKEFGTNSDEEKRGRNVYLKEKQWIWLEDLSEEKGVSLNAALRKILEVFQEQGEV